MSECNQFYDVTIVDKIINAKSKTYCMRDKGRASTFPEDYHPRRKMMYKPWACSSDTFFKLRSRGLPVLTAYFLCETTNNVRTYRSISCSETLLKDEAANTLKII